MFVCRRAAHEVVEVDGFIFKRKRRTPLAPTLLPAEDPANPDNADASASKKVNEAQDSI
jgi:hypothetical protein